MKLSQYIYVLGMLLLLGSCSGNTESETKKESKPFSVERLLGKWRAVEMENGVTCIVTFSEGGRMSEYFESPDGHYKERPCEYAISGDTLHVHQRTGTSSLVFEVLNDSLLQLRTLDSLTVSFSRLKAEAPDKSQSKTNHS